MLQEVPQKPTTTQTAKQVAKLVQNQEKWGPYRDLALHELARLANSGWMVAHAFTKSCMGRCRWRMLWGVVWCGVVWCGDSSP